LKDKHGSSYNHVSNGSPISCITQQHVNSFW
jgi:hypothetical protein